MRNYRIIRKRKTQKTINMLKKVRKEVAKKMGYDEPKPVIEFDYGLSEVYYDKNRKHPNGWTEPNIRYEDPKEIITDLKMMLEDAKKSLTEWLIYDVSDKKTMKKVKSI